MVFSEKYKKLWLALFAVVTFFLMIGFWYFPVLFKGYPAMLPEAEGIILGRNYAQSGVLGLENKLNVVLAPELVKDSAQSTSLGNQFTPFSYALIFKIFGSLSWRQLLLLSCVLYALAAIFFTMAVYYLFGLEVALLFPFVFALLPFVGASVQFLGTYEFAVFYFSLFTLLYFWGRDQKFNWIYLCLAGLFLGLACLAREAFFILLPIFFGWQLYYKKIKEMLWVFIPVVLLLAVFWLPAFFTGGNDYLKLFQGNNQAETHVDFQFYSHIFSDPYTLHFAKDSILKQLDDNIDSEQNGLMFRLSQLKLGQNMGLRGMNLGERILTGTSLLVNHLAKYLAIESIGGPIFFILMIAGLYELKKKNKENYYLFAALLFVMPLLLSYLALVGRSHLIDIGWIIAVLIALGLTVIGSVIKDYYQLKFSKIIYFFIILLVLYSLVLADHVYWGRGYDSVTGLALEYLAGKMNSLSIAPAEVVAVGQRDGKSFLNYLTGQSTVFFSPETVKKLIKEQKLQEAFDAFQVKYIVGYQPELAREILKNSQVKDIADWPAREEIEPPVTFNQSWFMNFVK